MSDMTREQVYRRWKKGEDQHDLAKKMGVTRERMRHILKKMDENVPLVDRIEELEAENNLLKTSGIIEVAVRNPRVMEYMQHWEGRAEAAEAKLAKAVEALELALELADNGLVDFSRYGLSCDADINKHYRTTLAELKGQDDE